MKHQLTIFLLFCSMASAYAQSIDRKVLPTTGGSSNDSNLIVNYTVGETMTTTFSNGGLIVTQGFQQADSLYIVSASVTTNGPTTFCEGNSVGLQANTDADLSYQWMLNASPINGATNAFYVASQAGSYTVRVSHSNQFYMVSDAVVVTVNPLPLVGSTVSPSAIVCGGSPVTLSGTGALTYTWSGGVQNAISFIASTTTTYTITGTDANGCIASATTLLTVKTQPSVNAISNQNYCNGQSVAAIPLSGLPTGVLFDISGGVARGLPNQQNVNAIPAFTATSAGTSIVSITPHADGCIGPVSTYTMTVSNCPPVTLNLKFYIDGYYLSAGMMKPVLYNQGEISDPNSLLTDYVIVELHAVTPPYATLKTTIATLKTNGTLACTFPGSVTNTAFYIVVHHRNSIVTWSAEPVTIMPNMTYDFSTEASKAYGSNQVDVSGNGTVWAIYNGDINQDENIDLLDLSDLESDINGFLYGYLTTDINGDGNADLLDVPIVENNTNDFIFSAYP